MGYDVSASIIQGWKLNDFFEGYANDELEYIYNVFEEYGENEDDIKWFPDNNLKEGVTVDRNYDNEEYYIGLGTIKGGYVANRGGPSESIFELWDLTAVKNIVIRVMKQVAHPVFQLIVKMMEDSEPKNYLLLSEGY